MRYTYDAVGNRVSRIVSDSNNQITEARHFIYSLGDVALELDRELRVERERLVVDGQLIAVEDLDYDPQSPTPHTPVNKETVWVLSDYQNSPSFLYVDINRIQSLRYTTYGVPYEVESSTYSDEILRNVVSTGYMGLEYEREIDGYLASGRFYDPASGRYTSETASGLLLGAQNLYMFANNTPADRVAGGVTSVVVTFEDWDYSELGHLGLDLLGMLPGIGAIADAANAGWYYYEGDYKNAALSGAAAIPGLGVLAAGSKLGMKAVSAGVKAAKATNVSSLVTAANGIQKAAQGFTKSSMAFRTMNIGANFAQSADSIYTGVQGIRNDPTNWMSYASVGIGLFGAGINTRAAGKLGTGASAAASKAGRVDAPNVNPQLPIIDNGTYVLRNGGCFTAETLVVIPSEVETADDFSVWDSAALTFPQVSTKAIAAVALGSRVLGDNPCPWEIDEQFEVPEETSWQKVLLVVHRASGSRTDVELLRPRSWIEAVGLRPHAQLQIVQPELGVEGVATVISIEDCPTIAEGDGHVVTGRFTTYDVSRLVRLLLSDGTEIDVTAAHHIWSVTRQDWVSASELQIAEELDGVLGTLRVESITELGSHPAVYNLEVHSHHVYRVATTGVLVHNTCPGAVAPRSAAAQVSYADSDMAAVALSYRKARAGIKLRDGRRLDRGNGNIAVFEYLDDNNQLVKRAFLNRMGDDHAELWGMRVLNRAGISRDRISRVYSELEYCPGCESLTKASFPNAARSYSFPYNIQRALGRQMKSEAVQRALGE